MLTIHVVDANLPVGSAPKYMYTSERGFLCSEWVLSRVYFQFKCAFFKVDCKTHAMNFNCKTFFKCLL